MHANLKRGSVSLAALMMTLSLFGPLRAEEARAAAPAKAISIRVDNFTFTPAEITVAAGTTITWINGDDIPHTVVATNKTFKSKVLDTDQEFSFTFTTQGAYEYFCSLHPHMTGKVIVK